MTDEQTPANGHDADEDFDISETPNGDVEQLQAEIAQLKDQMLRIAADAENTKRRAERDANDARAYAIQKFARDLLGVSDNLTRALAHVPADHGDSAVKNFIVGVEMTEKELQGAFERNGLKKIDPAKGEKFDPHKHQAMLEQPAGEVAPGAVIQVLQPGYELLGRLVRPAMVVVAAKTAAKPDGGGNPYAANDPGPEPEGGGAVDTRA